MTQCLSPGGNDQVDNEDLHMDGGEFEGDESEAYQIGRASCRERV